MADSSTAARCSVERSYHWVVPHCVLCTSAKIFLHHRNKIDQQPSAVLMPCAIPSESRRYTRPIMVRSAKMLCLASFPTVLSNETPREGLDGATIWSSYAAYSIAASAQDYRGLYKPSFSPRDILLYRPLNDLLLHEMSF